MISGLSARPGANLRQHPKLFFCNNLADHLVIT